VVLVWFPRTASQLSVVATVAAVVVVGIWRVRQAKSVNRELPEAPKAATAKQTWDPGTSPPTGHRITSVATLYGQAATVVPAGTGTSFR
jgi:negative regulator of sigma E activity